MSTTLSHLLFGRESSSGPTESPFVPFVPWPGTFDVGSADVDQSTFMRLSGKTDR